MSKLLIQNLFSQCQLHYTINLFKEINTTCLKALWKLLADFSKRILKPHVSKSSKVEAALFWKKKKVKTREYGKLQSTFPKRAFADAQY